MTDKELERKCRRACEDLSECIHVMAHEPSLGLYRIQEHARKSVVSLADSRNQVNKIKDGVCRATYDIQSGTSVIEALCKTKSVFAEAHENVRNSIHLKQQIEFLKSKQE